MGWKLAHPEVGERAKCLKSSLVQCLFVSRETLYRIRTDILEYKIENSN